MEKYLKNWPAKRIIYLIVSIAILVAAVYYNYDYFLLILGGGFLIQTMLNVGCSSGQCERPTHFNYRRRH
jgi:hypothetical protein